MPPQPPPQPTQLPVPGPFCTRLTPGAQPRIRCAAIQLCPLIAGHEWPSCTVSVQQLSDTLVQSMHVELGLVLARPPCELVAVITSWLSPSTVSGWPVS